jgi:GT2 family glycosyltransferase
MIYSERINKDFPYKTDSSIYKILQDKIPLWIFGTEEQNLRKGFCNVAYSLSKEIPSLNNAAAGLAFWNWQQFPLNISTVNFFENNAWQLSAGVKNLLNILKQFSNQQTAELPVEEIKTLLESGDAALVVKHLMPLLRGPQSLFWLGEVWDGLLRIGNRDLIDSALDMTNWPEGSSDLRQRLGAEYSFLYDKPDLAMAEADKLSDEIWPLWKNYIKAELLSRTGETGRASTILTELWKIMPYHINWALKLHTLMNPVSTVNALENSAEVSILLYSWNNEKLIEQTLKNLSSTKIGAAKIFTLNNGSSDGTGKIMEKSSALFPDNNFNVTHLPVNVGAPAARNWLLSIPEVRRNKWAVFLDDDVILPENWLEQLLATAREYPQAGAVGCRITSASDPITMQSADYHLFAPGDGASQINGLSEYIMIHDNCRSAFDYGQFTYCRPAMHISGCCHMLSLDAINSCGNFDVRFNPTQFDDLERDMRAYLAGKKHIYAGQLAVRHIQHSSLAKAATTKSMAQIFGNKIKLEGLFGRDELNFMANRDVSELWQDMHRRLKEIE